jgi:hypothetical protein
MLLIAVYLDLRISGFFNSDPYQINLTTRDSVYLPPVVVNMPPGKPTIIVDRPVPADVDTQGILKAYFREITYHDSIVNDTVKISLKETISENAIRSRELSWQLKMPIQTIVNNYEPKRQLFIGGQAVYSNSAAIYPFLAYKNKKNHLVTGYYDPWNKAVGVGYSVPITIRNPFKAKNLVP